MNRRIRRRRRSHHHFHHHQIIGNNFDRHAANLEARGKNELLRDRNKHRLPHICTALRRNTKKNNNFEILTKISLW